MLQKLVIRNYAIIDHLSLEPDKGLNTVTGETGAGKSIILGALSLILGERADTTVLINKDEKSVVEGYFEVSKNTAFKAALADEDIDFEPQCIIRREIAASGKSRVFVNDTPVTLQVLNRLTSLLVDLQQQFSHTAIGEADFQGSALDAIAGTATEAAAYRLLYTSCRAVQRRLAEKRAQRDKIRQESDFRQYQLSELEEANFADNEIEDAEVRLKQMAHAERILSVLQYSTVAMQEGEQPIINELKRVQQQLQSIADVAPGIKVLQERLNAAVVELRDIAAEIEAEQGRVAHDPEVMEQLHERLDIGNRLLKKHGLRTTAELQALRQSLAEEQEAGVELEQEIERLEIEADAAYKAVVGAAGKLSANRRLAVPDFATRINELLVLVGMPNARFEVRMETCEPGADGADEIAFMIDANRSGHFLPVQKAASGGEMSRIMLCIKSLVASALHMPTLIFDEVDTGISGEAARQVGILLRSLGANHQVICITHQPQVAARGTRHFYVYKEADVTGRLATKIRALSAEERIQAIARMIGGEQPSDSAISNARELVVSAV